MEDIIEQYGIVLLQILGGVAAMMLYMQLYERDNLLWSVLVAYFESICG